MFMSIHGIYWLDENLKFFSAYCKKIDELIHQELIDQKLSEQKKENQQVEEKLKSWKIDNPVLLKSD